VNHGPALTVNGRTYSIPPTPIVGICLDGCEPAYLDEAAHLMPQLQAMIAAGTRGEAHSVVPSFTNPNNVAIVTGVPPDVNGIPGNYYYDPEADEEVLMQDPRWLRCSTLLAGFAEAGLDVAAVTTKDKLRAFLSEGLPPSSIRFSVEKAHEVTLELNGIAGVTDLMGRDNPGIYDPEASVFCIEAGARLMTRTPPPRVLYLSTTDFVQHKYAPGSDGANAFYARLDLFLGELHRSGAIVGITADHGMNGKTKADGSPKVEYLESLLREAGVEEARVILPITDPYVVHHGALGSFCTVYLSDGADEDAIAEKIRGLDGVLAVYNRADGCAEFELPEERMGDLIVISEKHKVLGSSAASHDLSGLNEPLRSHGGLTEQKVPLLMNKPSPGLDDDRRLRNFDIFDVALNFAG
jgi:phosphonoacetate hydrolase